MIKLNKKYKPLFRTQCRYIICTGGRGSSKSFSVQTALCHRSISENTGVLFTRYTMISAEKSIIPEFKEKIELLNAESIVQVNKRDILFNHNKSHIHFSGIKTSSGDQTANLKSLKGFNIWVVDEAEELTDESKFDAIDLSFRDNTRQNIIILILNPTTKEHWIYKRFFEQAGVNEGFNGEKGDTCYIHTSYLDNEKHLSESFLKQVERIKQYEPDKYKHVILGGWRNKAEGVIFENWRIGEFDQSLPYYYGLDFGFSVDPDALVKVAIDEKRKLLYVEERLYRNGLNSDALDSILKSQCGNTLIIADSAEGRLIEDLKRSGLNIIPCKKGAGSILEGIKLIQNYTIVVCGDSKNYTKELNNYAWHDKKSETPIDDFNHLIDPTRYVLAEITKPQGIFGIFGDNGQLIS